jgi:glutamate transport system substrate-binding protein
MRAGLLARCRYLSAAVMAATALAVASCSADPHDSADSVGKDAAQPPGIHNLDQLIAAEKPAASSLMPAGSTARKIKDRGQLIVGGTQTAQLFSLFDTTTGKVEGFDAAMSELLAQYIIGRPDTSLVNVNAQIREGLLEDHSVDAVFATYTITPERAKLVRFAGPYFMDGLAIEVRKGASSIKSMKDLAGKSVVTELGSTASADLQAAVPSASIQRLDTNSECLDALQSHQADAYVLDQSILAGNVAAGNPVKVLPGTYSKEPYGIGLPKDEADFESFVDAWLHTIETDGTWTKVWQATLGSAVPGPAPAPPKIN